MIDNKRRAAGRYQLLTVAERLARGEMYVCAGMVLRMSANAQEMTTEEFSEAIDSVKGYWPSHGGWPDLLVSLYRTIRWMTEYE